MARPVNSINNLETWKKLMLSLLIEIMNDLFISAFDKVMNEDL